WVNLIGTWDAPWDPRAELEQRLGRPLDWDAIEPERMAAEYALADAEPLMPGVADILEEAAAAGVEIAIASSSSERWVRHHLERLGIADRFAALATRHDVPRTKPDPALYSLALERLGVAAPEAFALEDSVHGLAAAKASGLQVVAVPGPLMVHADFSAAEIRLDSLAGASLPVLAEHLGFASPL
ncbi:HAD family hydrolase, partial [bacterium]|nr:HAD family hydrolase [bacterium]